MARSGLTKRRAEEEWQAIISQAARSGSSLRAFCQAQGISHRQLYYWRQKLIERGGLDSAQRPEPTGCFALVTDRDNPDWLDAGIELVLVGGRRIRISRGFDPETLEEVVAVLEGDQC